MSSLAYREDVDEGPEITLSSTSLLGIFFGLVLICGVFFGFGYSVGRRSSEAAPLAASTSDETFDTPALSAKPAARMQDQTADSVAAENSTTERDDSAAGSSTGALSANPSNPSNNGAVTLPMVETEDTPATLRTADTDPANVAEAPALETRAGETRAGTSGRATSAPEMTPVLAKGSPQESAQAVPVQTAMVRTMVQIAAVSRQEDAAALLAALRNRGYNVALRSQPGDNLLHVQVGPFATRAQADIMRQKLLSDGYNAIVKQ